MSPHDAPVQLLRSGMHIFLHGAAATPTPLVEALCRREDLHDVTLYHMHTEGPAPFLDESCRNRFRSVSFFTGAAVRTAVQNGSADFIPIFLSDIPGLFTSRTIPLDAAIVQLSPPDRHGLCSLGTSVDAARAAIDAAPIVIAEINHCMPRTLGNTALPIEKISAFIETHRPLHQHPVSPETPVEAAIGEQVAALIPDGATLQAGIGSIPDAVLRRLRGKLELGVHTEMFSDGIVELAATGAITNRRKRVFPGLYITSFVSGSQRVFDFVNDNPLVNFLPCNITNDTNLLRKIENLTAINSALQVDLSGQVCADSLGHRIYSGIGGQMDFIRGAAMSPGGLPVIALPSTAGGGRYSRIVPELTAGAGVVTTRGHVHWVVTEFGAVNLHGRSLRQRGDLLIGVAHPDFRAELRQQWNGIRHYSL